MGGGGVLDIEESLQTKVTERGRWGAGRSGVGGGVGGEGVVEVLLTLQLCILPSESLQRRRGWGSRAGSGGGGRGRGPGRSGSVADSAILNSFFSHPVIEQTTEGGGPRRRRIILCK